MQPVFAKDVEIVTFAYVARFNAWKERNPEAVILSVSMGDEIAIAYVPQNKVSEVLGI